MLKSRSRRSSQLTSSPLVPSLRWLAPFDTSALRGMSCAVSLALMIACDSNTESSLADVISTASDESATEVDSPTVVETSGADTAALESVGTAGGNSSTAAHTVWDSSDDRLASSASRAPAQTSGPAFSSSAVTSGGSDDKVGASADASVDPTSSSGAGANGLDAGASSADAWTSLDASLGSTDPTAESTSEVTFPTGTPLVMLVIDGSSGVFSRLFYWGGSLGFGEFPDVWEATRAALSQLSGETAVRFWPVVYRAERDGACPNLYRSEELPLASNAELDGWLPPSADAITDTKQEGPLADALSVLTEKLIEYEHEGPKHMLFISDGPPGDSCTYFDAPPCNRDPVYGIVQNLYDVGIRTRMLNLGLAEGVEFAEDVSHAGNGESVIALGQDSFCIGQEAVYRGEIASDDDAARLDYAINWREHASADYLPDGETYSQQLSYSPTDAASLADAVRNYVQWVKDSL